MDITRTEEIYDLVLLGHGRFPGHALFHWVGRADTLQELMCTDFAEELRGRIGRVVRAETEECYHFEPYRHQGMRRDRRADDREQRLWGWQIGDEFWRLLVPAGEMPLLPEQA